MERGESVVGGKQECEVKNTMPKGPPSLDPPLPLYCESYKASTYSHKPSMYILIIYYNKHTCRQCLNTCTLYITRVEKSRERKEGKNEVGFVMVPQVSS